MGQSSQRVDIAIRVCARRADILSRRHSPNRVFVSRYLEKHWTPDSSSTRMLDSCSVIQSAGELINEDRHQRPRWF
jgi:hypothetical protein